eukprot:6101625-Pleurochrysis_carterae.AAC.1
MYASANARVCRAAFVRAHVPPLIRVCATAVSARLSRRWRTTLARTRWAARATHTKFALTRFAAPVVAEQP